jgi:glucose/arabinose dehydrogenase
VRRRPLPVSLVVAAVAGAALAAPSGGGADAGPTAVRLESIGSFSAPVHVAAPPGDSARVFVVEQAGRIRIVRGGRTNTRPFLDIRSRVLAGGERGLLSIAFAPDYASSRRFYVYFTERPAGDIRVMEYRASADADVADPRSARSIVRIAHRRFANHNGGQLAFGPDGLLYIGTGDGGGGNDPLRTAQDRRSLLGKILRVDPARRGARPRVYAYGLRNPFRFSFDRRTGDLTIGDVGQDAVEEIDFLRGGAAPGANFGWSVFEGTHRIRQGRVRKHREPVIQHSHGAGWCSIIGGFVVRDRLLPDLYGRYVYGDYCKGELYSARLGAGGARGVRAIGVRVPGLTSFGEDADGRLYAAALGGSVYRLR